MDIKKIGNICKKNGYGFELVGKRPRLLLIGETHNKLHLIKEQIKFIELIRPAVVLHEGYDIDDHSNLPGKNISEDFPALYGKQKMHELSLKYNYEFKPGDISFFRREDLANKLDSVIDDECLNWPDEIRGKELFGCNYGYSRYYSRLIVEPMMGLKLQKELKKQEGDVIGIYGDYHLRPSSQIHSILRMDFPPLPGSSELLFMTSQNLFIPQDYIMIHQYDNK